MDELFIETLCQGDPVILSKWMKKQPTRQLITIVKTFQVECLQSQEGKSISRVLAVVYFLKSVPDPTPAELSSMEYILDFIISKAKCDINESTTSLRPLRRSRRGFTPLLYCIADHKFTLVKLLIQFGADVNKADTFGLTPLHWTVYNSSSISTICRLVAAGADINSFNDHGAEGFVPPVLHMAVDEGRAEVVAFLISRGLADINTSAKYHNIVPESHWEEVRKNFRYDCGHVKTETSTQEITAIGRAVRMRKIDVLHVILSYKNVKISYQDLHFCILEGDPSVANVILRFMDKKDLGQDKICGSWALHCLGTGSVEYRTKSWDWTQAFAALIQTYIDNGFDINAISNSKDGPYYRKCLLTLAIRNSNIKSEFYQFLVDRGADPFLKVQNYGKDEYKNQIVMPFEYAIDQENLEAISIFVAAGFSVRTCSNKTHVEGTSEATLFERLLAMPMTTFENDWRTLTNKYTRLAAIIDMCITNQNIIPSIHDIYLASSNDWINEYLLLTLFRNLPSEESFLNVIDLILPIFNKVCKYLLEKLQPFDFEILSEILSIALNRGYDMDADYESCKTYNYGSLPSISVELAMLGGSICSYKIFNMLCRRPCNWNLPGVHWLNGLTSALYGDSIPIESGYTFPSSHPKTVFIFIANTLLRKGVVARHISINDLLTVRHYLIHEHQLLAKLWWAGATIDFSSIEKVIKNESISNEADLEAVEQFQNWMKDIAKPKNVSLKRLAAIAVRSALIHTEISQVKFPEPTIGKLYGASSSWLINTIRQPPS